MSFLRTDLCTLEALGSPQHRRAARLGIKAEIEHVASTFKRGERMQAECVEEYL